MTETREKYSISGIESSKYFCCIKHLSNKYVLSTVQQSGDIAHVSEGQSAHCPDNASETIGPAIKENGRRQLIHWAVSQHYQLLVCDMPFYGTSLIRQLLFGCFACWLFLIQTKNFRIDHTSHHIDIQGFCELKRHQDKLIQCTFLSSAPVILQEFRSLLFVDVSLTRDRSSCSWCYVIGLTSNQR